MRVTIDQSGCIRCGTCEGLCPEVFGLNENGLAEVVCQPEEGLEESAREAAHSCPVGVIAVEE